MPSRRFTILSRQKEREHLLTIDLVCYGVPSPRLYKEWIQDIAQKHGSKVSRVYFRDKKYGYAGVNVKVMLQNGQALEDIVDVKTYTKTMFSKIGLRPSCYKCVYRGRNKMSDFTIGDFWQIGDYSKQMDDDRGTSIVQINTRKGEDFLNDISSEKIKKVHVETLENDDLKSRIHKEDYTFEIPRNRTQFFDDSGRMSYDDLIRKYLPASRKDKMATALKPIIHKMPFSHFFFRTMKKVRMNRRKKKMNDNQKTVKVIHMAPLGSGGISKLTVTINELIADNIQFDYLVFRNKKNF